MPESAAAPVILVVDDDEGLLVLIGNALRREGWSVSTATSGAAALEWLDQNAADLMLLDLKLADIGASELMTRLADRKRVVPFLIITGQGDERVAVEMMKRGALDYLVKDVNFLEFVPGVVGRALTQIEQQRRLAGAEAALRESEERLTLALAASHMGVWEWHVRSDAVFWSPECFSILGIRSFSGGLESFANLIHPEDRERVMTTAREAVSKKAPYSVEFRVIQSAGEVRWLSNVGQARYDEAGQPVRVVGILMDITERKELEREILEISEREQNRIGQDLHDGLCQHLAGIEFRLLGLKQELQTKSSRQAAMVTALAKLLREGIDQTRTLARGLSPVMLEADGLMNALKELAITTEHAFGITCAFQCPTAIPVHDNAVATHLYRIAQEAIHNAIRHGKAKYIRIHLLAQNDRIVLGVTDDGVGFPKKPRNHNGMGLRVMQYRAGMVGGSLVVQHERAGGTSVICSLRPRGTSDQSSVISHQ